MTTATRTALADAALLRHDRAWQNEPMSTENDAHRLVAWSSELRGVHARLRTALEATRNAARGDLTAPETMRELLLFCHGFCSSLTEHHEGEDAHLFPAIAAAHPELAETLARLQQDHGMIAGLLAELAATSSSEDADRIGDRLDGIAAIMESHFRYEERALLHVLDALALDADPGTVLGSLRRAPLWDRPDDAR